MNALKLVKTLKPYPELSAILDYESHRNVAFKFSRGKIGLRAFIVYNILFTWGAHQSVMPAA